MKFHLASLPNTTATAVSTLISPENRHNHRHRRHDHRTHSPHRHTTGSLPSSVPSPHKNRASSFSFSSSFSSARLSSPPSSSSSSSISLSSACSLADNIDQDDDNVTATLAIEGGESRRSKPPFHSIHDQIQGHEKEGFEDYNNSKNISSNNSYEDTCGPSIFAFSDEDVLDKDADTDNDEDLDISSPESPSRSLAGVYNNSPATIATITTITSPSSPKSKKLPQNQNQSQLHQQDLQHATSLSKRHRINKNGQNGRSRNNSHIGRRSSNSSIGIGIGCGIVGYGSYYSVDEWAAQLEMSVPMTTTSNRFKQKSPHVMMSKPLEAVRTSYGSGSSNENGTSSSKENDCSGSSFHTHLSKQQLRLLQLQIIRNEQRQQRGSNNVSSSNDNQPKTLITTATTTTELSPSVSPSSSTTSDTVSHAESTNTESSNETNISSSPKSPISSIPLASSFGFSSSIAAASSTHNGHFFKPYSTHSSLPRDQPQEAVDQTQLARNRQLTSHLSLLQEAVTRAQLGLVVKDLESLEMS